MAFWRTFQFPLNSYFQFSLGARCGESSNVCCFVPAALFQSSQTFYVVPTHFRRVDYPLVANLFSILAIEIHARALATFCGCHQMHHVFLPVCFFFQPITSTPLKKAKRVTRALFELFAFLKHRFSELNRSRGLFICGDDQTCFWRSIWPRVLQYL